MAFKAKPNANFNKFPPQENIEPGSYPARVVNIVDLGVQPQKPFKGQAKPPCQMIRVTYELTDVFMKDENGDDIEDKPRWIAEEFKLMPLDVALAVSTKRYLAIDPQNEHDGDWSKLLNAGCMVGIVNNASKTNDRIYDNVSTVAVMRKRDLEKLPELQNPPFFFYLEDPDIEVFKKMPQWIQDKITSNLDFEGSKLQELIEGAPEEKPKAPAKKAAPAPEPEEAEEEAPWE